MAGDLTRLDFARYGLVIAVNTDADACTEPDSLFTDGLLADVAEAALSETLPFIASDASDPSDIVAVAVCMLPALADVEPFAGFDLLAEVVFEVALFSEPAALADDVEAFTGFELLAEAVFEVALFSEPAALADDVEAFTGFELLAEAVFEVALFSEPAALSDDVEAFAGFELLAEAIIEVALFIETAELE